MLALKFLPCTFNWLHTRHDIKFNAVKQEEAKERGRSNPGRFSLAEIHLRKLIGSDNGVDEV